MLNKIKARMHVPLGLRVCGVVGLKGLKGCGVVLYKKNERREVIQIWLANNGHIDTYICNNAFKNHPNSKRIETNK